MIDFEATEKQILELLAPLRDSGVQVRGLANEPGAIASQGKPKAYVTFVWGEIALINGGSLDGQAQPRQYQFILDCTAKALYGSDGLMSTLLPDAVKWLQGERVSKFGQLRFVKSGIPTRMKDGWGLLITFQVLRMDVA